MASRKIYRQGSRISHPYSSDSDHEDGPLPVNPFELISMLPSRQISVGEDGTIQRVSSSLTRQGSSLRRRRTMKQRKLASRRKPVRDFEMRGSGESMDTSHDGSSRLDGEEMPPPDEEEQWERQQTLKDMTASLSLKRHYRHKLQTEEVIRLQGWARWKHRQRIKMRNFKRDMNAFYERMKFWNSSLKTVEGSFGMSVASYFQFLRWLFIMNVFIAVILIGVVMVPQVVLPPHDSEEALRLLLDNSSRYMTTPPPTVPPTNSPSALSSAKRNYLTQSFVCSADYMEHLDNHTNIASVLDQFLDFLKGTGWMEKTVLFYGSYFNKTYYNTIEEDTTIYNMPLAYILATGAYFIVSLVFMVKHTAAGFKSAFITQGEKHYKYCNAVFGGWDFCMTEEKSARDKHQKLYREFVSDIENQKEEIRRKNRKAVELWRLAVVRFVINILSLGILGAAVYLINWVNNTTLELSIRGTISNDFLLLVVEYLPAAVIMILNVIIPLLFLKIVITERYSPEFEIKITLLRTVVLRFASLGTLVVSLHRQITNCDTKSCGSCLPCWETYVGQSLYKLVLLEFVVFFGVTIIEFIRKFVVVRLMDKSDFIRWFGLQEFDIPKNVLDLVYMQMLCWIGGFFCPLIPAITILKCFIVFYLKKWSLLNNCIPCSRTYHASKSSKFFMVILLISFLLTLIPVGYSIAKMSPSQSCGAFRVYSYDKYVMLDCVSDAIYRFPAILQTILRALGSPQFFVPFIIFLCIVIYYYYAVAMGQSRMAKLLKEQLVLEGKDKAFLLERVNEVLVRAQKCSTAVQA